MKKGKDISTKFDGLYLIHQNIPGKRTKAVGFEEHILFIPLHGQIRIEAAGKTINLGLGQMFFLPGGQLHSFSSSDHLGERLIALIDRDRLDAETTRPSVLPLHQLIKEILFYLLLRPKTKNAKSLVNVLCETLSETMRDSQTIFNNSIEHLEGRVVDPRIKRALSFMQENLAISMEQVAKQSGLSSRSFNRLVAVETGLQPKQWLINFRIDRARELLKIPGASVTNVALEVGYNSLGQFISAFRARTGQLPSEYMKRG